MYVFVLMMFHYNKQVIFLHNAVPLWKRRRWREKKKDQEEVDSIQLVWEFFKDLYYQVTEKIDVK